MNHFKNYGVPRLVLGVALLLLFVPPLSANEQPNILWITSEDNAAHWMGCYGNDQAKTPNIDALAKDGVTFTRAYSNAPVCAVARCTLLHGVYSVTLGTQHMRSRYPIPDRIRPYVSFLKEKGYYCTNNNKTDYNRAGNDKKIWDACGRKAHFQNRKNGQPFFAVFNINVCHESSLFPDRVIKNRNNGVIPKKTRLDPKQIALPPYLPDLPEVRNDFAIYHDNLTAMDKRVGKILSDLKKEGESENTIIFYYSDHGGPTPRGKRYLTDTGVRIPMVLHVPERWKAVSHFEPGTKSDESVSFIDLAPTLISLIGAKKPQHMQGRAFLGDDREEPKDDFVFLFGDRFDELMGMRRGVTDGKFKYIRRFMPHLPAAPYSYYQFSMPSWIAWQNAWKAGKLQPRHNQIWEQPQAVEELYDLRNDPWEIKNLAGESDHENTLTKMRGVLFERMLTYRDAGIVPEPMYSELAKKTVYQTLQQPSFDYPKLLEVAKTATSKGVAIAELRNFLSSENKIQQYWGAMGCAAQGKAASELEQELVKLAQNPNATLRIAAAVALEKASHRETAIKSILGELQRPLTDNEAVMLCNAITQLNCIDNIPNPWIDKMLKSDNDYLQRLAKRLRSQVK